MYGAMVIYLEDGREAPFQDRESFLVGDEFF